MNTTTIAGYRTREEVNAIIKETAEDAGFKVNTESRFNPWGVATIDAENLNCTTHVDTKYCPNRENIDDSYFIGKVTFSASISRMGGNPTPEDLINIADEITEMARLVARLNVMELEFAEYCR